MYDFEEFYHIGEELSEICDEAHIRSAINRDYYALFGESRKYLVEIRKKNYLESKKGIHRKVCNSLIYSKDPTEEYVGKILLKLIPIRGFADYDWRETDLEFFKKIFPQIRKCVNEGLESVDYLNRKYKNN